MIGMPMETGGFGYDTSMLQLAAYMFGALVGLIGGGIALGTITLPAFFAVLYVCDKLAGAAASATGAFPLKVVVIMFRGLRRSMLRTSLTYLALFVLTLVLCLIYAVLYMIGNATTEKEANFKAIVTHKTIIPSQMPPGYYEEFKRVCLEELPPEMRPANGDKDIMSWSFILGTTDKVNMRKDNMVFLFALEPNKVTTMMDGLDELTGQEKELLDRACQAMTDNKQAIVMSKSRLKALNKKVGENLKLSGVNFPNLVFDFTIIGELPDGKYEGVSFMNKDYLLQQIDAYERDRTANPKGEKHPMAEKSINLIWVRLPTKEAFEVLSQKVNDPAKFNKVPIKLETASSGIGTWLGAFKDIFWGIKFILVPAMIGIMSLVVANALSISVRERRTEMAVLKVLGFAPRHVLLIVLGEALLVGFLGGGMSALMAYGLLGNVKFQIMFFGAFFVPANALVYGPALGMAVSFAGCIGPALAAKNVKVAEVFARVA
ncbi:ABC transporter permease [Gemmata sp. JC717]|uniref:ABC transporter permease n=1 Tax=Gemmata algarum TaxID=2975278 RepID=UPI0021BB5DE1|nr:ABC transporter permease [Gemmata algarum]MDY3553851.1 ABC transporter permease [Gemmata algarum]